MKLKTHLATAIFAAIGGAYLYSQVRPPLKVVETKQVVKEQIVTVTKRTKQKDGTIVTERTKTEDRQKEATKLKTEPTKKDWNIALYATSSQLYGIAIQRRIIGDFSVYVSGQTNGQLAAGIGFSF